MAVIDARGFQLTPNVAPLAETIRSHIQGARAEKKEAEALKREMLRQNLKTTGAQFLRIRDMPDINSKKKAISELARSAWKRGEDIDVYDQAMLKTDVDELNNYLIQVATRAESFLGKDETLRPKRGTKALKEGDKLVDEETGEVIATGDEKVVPWQQGTGIMGGYSFNPGTNTWSLSPFAQDALDADAAKTAAEGKMLDSKKIADVNDKVTGLTKDVNGIVDSAKSLEALQDSSSPAAQIGAVFKFMKAMDPTSTVRESELGLVYSAEGAMKSFANRINAILGEGELSEEGFADIVNTAKTLANSAVDASSGAVSSYLNVLSDKMSVRDYNALLARVPGRLEITPILKDPGEMTDEEIKAELEQLGGK